jgi:hypothetical protein
MLTGDPESTEPPPEEPSDPLMSRFHAIAYRAARSTPEDRYPTAAQFADDITSALAEHTGSRHAGRAEFTDGLRPGGQRPAAFTSLNVDPSPSLDDATTSGCPADEDSIDPPTMWKPPTVVIWTSLAIAAAAIPVAAELVVDRQPATRTSPSVHETTGSDTTAFTGAAHNPAVRPSNTDSWRDPTSAQTGGATPMRRDARTASAGPATPTSSPASSVTVSQPRQGVAPAPAAPSSITLPPPPATAPAPAGASSTQRRYVCSGTATLRDIPKGLEEGARIIGTLPHHDAFDVDQPILRDTWAHGRSISLGKTGWVLVKYVRTTCPS